MAPAHCASLTASWLPRCREPLGSVGFPSSPRSFLLPAPGTGALPAEGCPTLRSRGCRRHRGAARLWAARCCWRWARDAERVNGSAPVLSCRAGRKGEGFVPRGRKSRVRRALSGPGDPAAPGIPAARSLRTGRRWLLMLSLSRLGD